ncbi:NAD(P)/FAD-dependent oxidoreductase [Streptomyces sp. INA 01156]
MSTGTLNRVVVVGNGIAGLTAADTLREAGFDGELTIVGDEARPAYSRPALSKALLLDRDDVSSHELPPAGHGAAELLGVRASGLDLDRRRVTLDDGTELPYDRVVLATGSRARRLSDLPGEVTLRGLDDALSLRERLADKPSVVVVGGGPLGMEIASGCLAAGCRVTVVSQGVPLILQLGPYLADVFVKAALEQGLTVVETAAARLEQRDGGTRVVLEEGPVLDAELVITAAGDVPTRSGSRARDSPRGVPSRSTSADSSARTSRPSVTSRPSPLSTACAASPVEQRDRTGEGRRHGARPRRGVPAAPVPAVLLDRAVRTEPEGDGPPSGGRGADVRRRAARGGQALLRWPHEDGTGDVVALNYRIPIPRLRRMTQAAT